MDSSVADAPEVDVMVPADAGAPDAAIGGKCQSKLCADCYDTFSDGDGFQDACDQVIFGIHFSVTLNSPPSSMGLRLVISRTTGAAQSLTFDAEGILEERVDTPGSWTMMVLVDDTDGLHALLGAPTTWTPSATADGVPVEFPVDAILDLTQTSQNFKVYRLRAEVSSFSNGTTGIYFRAFGLVY